LWIDKKERRGTVIDLQKKKRETERDKRGKEIEGKITERAG
jgi:hypothetical protein